MINREENETLDDFLNNRVFACQKEVTVEPDKEDVAGFDEFIERYKKGLEIERAAVKSL